MVNKIFNYVDIRTQIIKILSPKEISQPTPRLTPSKIKKLLNKYCKLKYKKEIKDTQLYNAFDTLYYLLDHDEATNTYSLRNPRKALNSVDTFQTPTTYGELKNYITSILEELATGFFLEALINSIDHTDRISFRNESNTIEKENIGLFAHVMLNHPYSFATFEDSNKLEITARKEELELITKLIIGKPYAHALFEDIGFYFQPYKKSFQIHSYPDPNTLLKKLESKNTSDFFLSEKKPNSASHSTTSQPKKKAMKV